MGAVAPWKRKYVKIHRRLPVEINEQIKTVPSCFRNTLPTVAGFVRMHHSAFSNLLVCRANNNNNNNNNFIIYLFIYFAESHDRI
jgi:hypothetical protein